MDILNRFHVGLLSSVDGYMNIALEKTEEYVDGELKKSYGDAFVRGNNGKKNIPDFWIFDTVLTSSQFFIFLRTD